ncbi:MAG: DUF933 domain-containing protein, partial [Candidatus Cloacimonetes bacterium]|nr:DUF933 domain-containing protein [Candidatus Cloacimonadota bacterium]
MNIGIIGKANSGKTTIFNALTKSEIETNCFSEKNVKPNVAVVNHIDDRIKKLSEMYEPKKTIFANIEFLDFAGIEKVEGKGNIFSPETMGIVKTCDSLAIVIRNFESDMIEENINLEKDYQNIIEDLILSDLIIAENRKEKIELNKKRGIKTTESEIEEKAIDKIIECLNRNKEVKSIELSEDEIKAVRGFNFLTLKPHLVIVNSSEIRYKKSDVIIDFNNCEVIEICGKFEMELNSLEDDEKSIFMQDMGIEESAIKLLTKKVYETMGLISFFTVGKDEVRAWTIKRGQNAVEAAGKIHSDLARGFIRAECFSYSDLIEHGDEKRLKEKGLL